MSRTAEKDLLVFIGRQLFYRDLLQSLDAFYLIHYCFSAFAKKMTNFVL